MCLSCGAAGKAALTSARAGPVPAAKDEPPKEALNETSGPSGASAPPAEEPAAICCSAQSCWRCCVAPFAFARRRGQADRRRRAQPELEQEPGVHAAKPEILTQNGTYGTRQSNKKDGDGGGAIYGCRSAPGHEPCIRANNLKNGRAFEFATRSGTAGRLHRRRERQPEHERDPVRHQRRRQGREPERRPRRRPARGRDHRPRQGPVGRRRRRRRADAQERRHRGDASSAPATTRSSSAATSRRAPTTRRSAAPTRPTRPRARSASRSAAGNANAVRVVTRDSGGAAADRPFHLTVNC